MIIYLGLKKLNTLVFLVVKLPSSAWKVFSCTFHTYFNSSLIILCFTAYNLTMANSAILITVTDDTMEELPAVWEAANK